jgi:hypothetical protein
MREEKTTTQEIQALERKFEAWSQMTEPAVVRKPQQKPLASARDITKDLPKEVAQFEVNSNIYTLIVKSPFLEDKLCCSQVSTTVYKPNFQLQCLNNTATF